MEKKLISEITKIKSMMGLINEGIIPPAVEKLFLRFLIGGGEKNAIKEFLETGINQLSKSSETELIKLMSKDEGEAYIAKVESEIGKIASGTDKKIAETHLQELKSFKDHVKLKSGQAGSKLAELQTTFSQLRDLESKDIAKDSNSRKILNDVKSKIMNIKSPKYLKYMEQTLQNEVTAIETQVQLKSPKTWDYVTSIHSNYKNLSPIYKAIFWFLFLTSATGVAILKMVGLQQRVENIKTVIDPSSDNSTSAEEPKPDDNRPKPGGKLN
jgi:hypothetical protein